LSSFVLAAVLFGALLHAAWNALIKLQPDKFAAAASVAILAGVVGLPVMAALPAPPAAAWPYLIASAIIHVGYFALVAFAYRSAHTRLLGADEVVAIEAFSGLSLPVEDPAVELRQGVCVLAHQLPMHDFARHHHSSLAVGGNLQLQERRCGLRQAYSVLTVRSDARNGVFTRCG